jgi:hypothetical protein
MATAFKINAPVTTPTNFVDVQNDLAVGTHHFQLVVVDEAGNRSNPAKAQVVVQQIILTTGGSVVPTPLPTPIVPTPGPGT